MPKIKKKIKRFHREIFFPKWSEQALTDYINEIIHGKSLSFSPHAVEKILDYGFDYGKNFLKYLIQASNKNSLQIPSIFEFYAQGEKVTKACFRLTFPDFPVDLVLVISADSVIITVFLTNKGDTHETKNKNLYERS